jgi:tRNA-Thr(GGU) m(6)t(6)A37 methyltransferase TsaA
MNCDRWTVLAGLGAMTSHPEDALRPAEKTVLAPPPNDAGLVFIGRIHTPWATRSDCPRRGSLDGPICRIEVFPLWAEALQGVSDFARLEVFYWLHQSRRDLVMQTPRRDGVTRGTFALRSPVRPNPIGTSVVVLLGIEGTTLAVRGLDCIDGTPLIDLKPDRSVLAPAALPTRGNAEG